MAKRQVAAAAKKQAAKGTGRVSHRRSTVWGFRSKQFQGDFHIIGERPGTMHHAYSVYITVASGKRWSEKGIDHDITKLVSNVADTALSPKEAASETLTIIREVVGSEVSNSRRYGI